MRCCVSTYKIISADGNMKLLIEQFHYQNILENAKPTKQKSHAIQKVSQKSSLSQSLQKSAVMKNFGFLLPKHSVLKNLPKLPIIQRKFRLKPPKLSSHSQ